jgi:hypothetical protein
MTNKEPLNQNLLMTLISQLADEVITHGQKEAELIKLDCLSEKQADQIAKANAFLTTYALLLIEVYKTQNFEIAQVILEVWEAQEVQELMALVFEKEFKTARTKLDNSIDVIENYVNNPPQK